MAAKRNAWTYKRRTATGQRMVSVWLPKDVMADIRTLGEMWGLVGVRDILVQAVTTCVKDENLKED